MKTKKFAGIVAVLVTAGIGASSILAAKGRAAPPAPLTPAGRALEAKYAERLETLRTEILKAVPTPDPLKKSAYLKAVQAEKTAEKKVNAAQQDLGRVARAQALVAHAKGKWIGGAEKGIAAAKAKLRKATTAAEREAARKELAKWQANKKEGLKALKERQAALDKAKREEPKLIRNLKAAEKTLGRAKARTTEALEELNLASFLSSDKWDAKLAEFVVLLEATPHRLAAFAQKNKRSEELIDQMLADGDLLVQMAVADGAKDGNYGQAMKIYRDIRKASPEAQSGALQRLALAIALEHATPIAQRNAKARTEAPATVDPVKRYLHYRDAFLNHELDPAFGDLTVWDYRMVVNGEEPDEIAAWGRRMLRNYRPDEVSKRDYRWRYVEAVRTEIRYGSQDNKYDRDDLQFFQNILMNGGVCGRRAFFGRFILRAFGIPTTARPQRGHAALTHWTPEGWVICLGAGWGHGWTKTRYTKDLDFLANTQARMTGKPYLQVKRAQWIGDVMGEPRVFGLLSGNPEFWYSVSLYTQRRIVADAEAKTPAAVGADIAEANETKEKIEPAEVTLTDADRRVVVGKDGVITIPAAATSKPTRSTGKIIFMPSNLGGTQLHYSRNGRPQDFEYTFNAPAAGTYALTARVVTPSWKQHLLLSVNGAKEPVDIPLPHTVGMWGTTQPVVVTLSEGKNVLRFSHKSEGYAKGFSIRDFTLRPK